MTAHDVGHPDSDRSEARRSSRRSALGLGVAAGTFAAVFRPTSAGAANGDPVLIGRSNEGTASTVLTVPSGIGLTVVSEDGAGPALNVVGPSGGAAILGRTEGGTAVHGQTSGGLAVFAESTWGTGLRAFSGFDVAISAGSDFGKAIVAGSRDTAVQATSSSIAVHATAIPRGQALATAVVADCEDGVALDATGRVTFNRSGRVEVPVGQRSVTIPVVGGVTDGTLVFAQLRANPNNLVIRSAVPDADTGSIVVRLSGVVSRTTRLSWFVLD
jgi:hypothetical protein